MKKEKKREHSYCEKTFKANGFRCEIWANDLGHRCGYIILREGHPYFGWHYDAIHTAMPSLEVHGGLTYAGFIRGKKGWMIGFDCGHYSDARDPGILEYFKRDIGLFSQLHDKKGTIWTLEMVKKEVERLSFQMVQL